MCDLTSGYVKGCRNGRGGITQVDFIQIAHLSSAAVVDGEVPAITLTNGNRSWRYKLEQNLSQALEVQTSSRDAGSNFNAQTVTLVLNDNTKTTRNGVMTLVQNDVAAIVKYANGDYELFGIANGLSSQTVTRDSGVTKADRNGNTIVLIGMEDEKPPKVASGIVDALLIPAS